MTMLKGGGIVYRKLSNGEIIAEHPSGHKEAMDFAKQQQEMQARRESIISALLELGLLRTAIDSLTASD